MSHITIISSTFTENNHISPNFENKLSPPLQRTQKRKNVIHNRYDVENFFYYYAWIAFYYRIFSFVFFIAPHASTRNPTPVGMCQPINRFLPVKYIAYHITCTYVCVSVIIISTQNPARLIFLHTVRSFVRTLLSYQIVEGTPAIFSHQNRTNRRHTSHLIIILHITKENFGFS